jgi:hypothetical protein
MRSSTKKFRQWSWGVMFAAICVAAAACGGGDESAEDLPDSASASPSQTTAVAADPLEGDWRAEFTCRQAKAAVLRVMDAAEVSQTGWESECSPRDRFARVARFKDGVLVLCDEADNACDVQASYEVVGADQVHVTDPEGNLCDGAGCQVDWTFHPDGDTMTFETQDDPWVLSTWQVVPFQRIG